MKFDQTLRSRVAANLSELPVRERALEGRRHAAVAIVLLDSDAELHGVDELSVDRQHVQGFKTLGDHFGWFENGLHERDIADFRSQPTEIGSKAVGPR